MANATTTTFSVRMNSDVKFQSTLPYKEVTMR